MKIFVTYSYGGNLRNNFSVVEAENYGAGREKIHEVTGGKFAFAYTDEADFARQIEQYGLTEVPLQPQIMEE